MIERNNKIEEIKKSLSEMAFKDIIKASNGGAKMGAFILASCFIDYLTCLFFNEDSTKRNYKEFVKIFLDTYDPENLYGDLRCKVVHNYSEGGSYIFTDNQGQLHLKRARDGRIILNLEDFIKDIETAMYKYFALLESDSACLDRAINRIKKVGILGVGPVQLKSP